MSKLKDIATRAVEYVVETNQTGLPWDDLRFGIQMGLIPSTNEHLPPSEVDRLTDMILRRLGRHADTLDGI